MLAKRIIAALDIKGGRVVKGVNFENIRDAGDPIELAKRYEKEGIDELVFLDISATQEGRDILYELVEEVARELHIPFTVGGGVRSLNDIERLIRNGADKVFMNTAAVEDPSLIERASNLVGSSNLVVAIDAKREGDKWKVYTHGGTKERDLRATDWAEKVENLGAGEILLTSMDTDGTEEGFDIPFSKQVSRATNIPVIASGGAGSPEDFYEIFEKTEIQAALGASIFHYREYSVEEVKKYLKEGGIDVRC